MSIESKEEVTCSENIETTYQFLCQHILKKEFSNCPLCHGLGYYYQQHTEYYGQRDYNPRTMENFVLCACMKKKCAMKNKVCPPNPPYEYYNHETKSMSACPCKPVRTRLTKIRHYLKKSHIPFKYRGKFIENIEIYDDNITIAVDLANETILKLRDANWRAHGLYIHGNPGCGKTLLSCVMLNELLRFYACRVTYAKVSRDILSKLRASYNPNSESYGEGAKIEQELTKTDVLVIDDFGIQKENESTWVQSVLYDIIDARYENHRCTIINSNDPMEELEEKGNIRLYSRLREMCREIRMSGPDYRLSHHGSIYN